MPFRDGREVLQQQSQIPESEYHKKLDMGLPAPQPTSETVRYWSDFSKVYYHPRSVVQLNDYETNSRTAPFDDWEVGKDLFANIDKEHDILDRDLRPFIEECDHVQALQIFTSADDAWGGFASRYVDRLRDEFEKKSIWVWAIEGGSRVPRVSGIFVIHDISCREDERLTEVKQKKIKHDLNKARSVYAISPQSSLYTPIIDPPSHLPGSVHIDPQSELYSTALICSALETATLPSRLRRSRDFEASLAGLDNNRKIFELESTLIDNERNCAEKPNGKQSHDVAQSTQDGMVEEIETRFDLDFTYDDPTGQNQHIFNQTQVVRGVELGAQTSFNRGCTVQRFYTSEQTLQRLVE